VLRGGSVAFEDVEAASKHVLDGADEHRPVETSRRPGALFLSGVRVAFLSCSGVELELAACRVRGAHLRIGRTEEMVGGTNMVGVLFVEALEGEVAPLIAGRGAFEGISQAHALYPGQNLIEEVIIFIAVGGDHDSCGELESLEGLAIEKDDATDLAIATGDRYRFPLEPLCEGPGFGIRRGTVVERRFDRWRRNLSREFYLPNHLRSIAAGFGRRLRLPLAEAETGCNPENHRQLQKGQGPEWKSHHSSPLRSICLWRGTSMVFLMGPRENS